MSSRSGNNRKKGQKYQNSFTFKHNPNSMKTRKISQSPLDFLCDRCHDILEWKIKYRKYKPLSTPSKCIVCMNRTIFKAYRLICEICAIPKKLCTKCGNEVESYNEYIYYLTIEVLMLRKLKRYQIYRRYYPYLNRDT